jgi:hypothetical protein
VDALPNVAPKPGKAPGPLSLQDTGALLFPKLIVKIHSRRWAR